MSVYLSDAFRARLRVRRRGVCVEANCISAFSSTGRGLALGALAAGPAVCSARRRGSQRARGALARRRRGSRFAKKAKQALWQALAHMTRFSLQQAVIHYLKGVADIIRKWAYYAGSRWATKHQVYVSMNLIRLAQSEPG